MQLVENQGGDISYLENTDKFEKSKYILEVKSNEEGYISLLDARKVGELSGTIGAGRVKKEDKIDETVGIVLVKKVGDFVKVEEVLAYVHANNLEFGEYAVKELQNIYQISREKIEKTKTILGVIA